ncbi:uncharacterized protein LOC125668883 [Ostrea edulis]|uniref:uncharacterized protein LOC125668883 n=1 Tax=Ostrea edulis TaxID=37623 RepID=UPI0024AF3D3E|nr:uncharacterized protein LOC125668883 [Ostrea edulis]
MKYLQIFVIVLVVGLCFAQRGGKDGSGRRKFPKFRRHCSSDTDCPKFAICIKMQFTDKSICVPKKMVNMIEKKLSQLPALKGCSVDGDCGVFGKCMEVPKSGKRMCMPEVIGKMLQSKLPQLPGEHKTCAAHAECSGSAKCLAFPKFEKQMCLVENGRLHRILMIIHRQFVTDDKKQPDNKDDQTGNDKKDDIGGPENKDDDKDDDIDDVSFINDPQFLKEKKTDKQMKRHHKSHSKSHRRMNPWNMYFMGVFSLGGLLVLILFVLLCCLQIRKRNAQRETATEEPISKENLTRNAFLTKISSISNPYSKLENEKNNRV